MAGSVRPETLLSTLVGRPAAGTWSFKTVDDNGGAVGVFRSWSLGLCVAP